MVSPFYHKSASFLITLVGVVTNTALAIQVLAASRSIKWEPEFEWDSSNDTYKVDSIKVVWGLLLSYCVSAAAVGAVGLVGVVKVRRSRSQILLSPDKRRRANPLSSGSTETTPSPTFPSAPS